MKKCFRYVILFVSVFFFIYILSNSPLLSMPSDIPNVWSDCSKEVPLAEAVLDESKDAPKGLSVHYLDVGQGDSTLIICDGHAMLVDTSTQEYGLFIQKYLRSCGVDSLDYLVLTHPDADHIGSAPTILRRFNVEQVLTSYIENTENYFYQKLVTSLWFKNITPTIPSVGDSLQLGGASVQFIGPQPGYESTNNASLSFILTYGDSDYLFTGDAESEAEQDMLEYVYDIEVYKVGHHGSSTSTTESFLKKAAPEYAVISCALNNEYGFPHKIITDRLSDVSALVYRTDLQGTIISYSDGSTITWGLENVEQSSGAFTK